MEINFYEEYPTQKNLEKLILISYPIKLFVAAQSLKEFNTLEKKIKQIKKDVEVAYWPIIPNSYWISPFSNTKDLEKLFQELEMINNPLLIDLELPKNKTLILKNIPYFLKNRKLIKKFLEQNKTKISTAEFPASIISFFVKIAGLDYNIKTEKSLMFYTSMNPKIMNKNIKKNLLKIKDKENYSISLGTIATGVLGNEPILSPENLEKDLEFVKKAGFDKVIIFRLGGLNKKYIQIINKFQKYKK
jgi:hypothetical protein